jgi:hypothetical protein
VACADGDQDHAQAGHDSRDIAMRSTVQALGAAANKSNAERFAANIIPIIREIQASGVTTLRGRSMHEACNGLRPPWPR